MSNSLSKVSTFFEKPMSVKVVRWRAEYEASDDQRRLDGLLAHLSSCLHQGRHGRLTCKLKFLGVPLCKRAFCKVTRTAPQRYIKLAKRGVLSWVRTPFAKKPRPQYDEMYAALRARLPFSSKCPASTIQSIWHRTHLPNSTSICNGSWYKAISSKIELMKNSSPFAHGDHGHSPDVIMMPFAEKIFLYRMILLDWETSRTTETRVPLFAKKPKYSTFYRVLQDPHFANLRFHRVVDIGRCPKCCYLRYKCMEATAGSTERAEWQRLAAAHQMLQLEQKKADATPHNRLMIWAARVSRFVFIGPSCGDAAGVCAGPGTSCRGLPEDGTLHGLRRWLWV